MPFQIIRADIARVHADVIVNSANPKPICGGGAERAIFEAAGMEEMLKARQKIGPISPGEAAVTDAFGLSARYVVHTVGPVWAGGTQGEIETLASCYRKCLLLAQKLEAESIAFPMISTGVYGFPKDRALETALSVIRWFLEQADMEITLVVFDMTSYDLSAHRLLKPKESLHERRLTRTILTDDTQVVAGINFEAYSAGYNCLLVSQTQILNVDQSHMRHLTAEPVSRHQDCFS